MKVLKCIVVGVDFSGHCENAMREAQRLARRSGATIFAVHVVRARRDGQAYDPYEEEPEDDPTRPIISGHSRLFELADQVRDGSAKIETLVRVGNPYGEVNRVVKETAADLLILGHLTAACVRKLACPVLLVRRDHTRPFRKVSAVVDLGEGTGRIIEQGIRLAQAEGSSLQLCKVCLPPWRVVHYRAPTPRPTEEEKERYKQEVLQSLAEALDPFRDDLGGVEVECRLIESTQNVIGIEHFVEETGSDLVILCSRGLRPAQAPALHQGRTHHPPRPVLGADHKAGPPAAVAPGYCSYFLANSLVLATMS